ncbi:homolog to cytochrome c-type biogenesis protein CcdA [Natronomonas moolapensis 8.8.11]|uniref:Homolog to cytochrome c-type biogenesis protein CcdA n=1 Tax=Natronomonas moolapensis (strain DSM 18674 / CECT 7526 / JCM 14361 / 8.8.11) TaxID=268739 RepID=M1XSV8_NATM8|nr:hypothetical protein [Natronomonas moolapensis]CCQ37485.1 homolog to cytochrome c-type biogenesis protein CcdA [Natronomonas moolapensis 8.8.11]
MSAVPGSVDTDRQPPMTVPLRHFAVGLGFLLAGAVLGAGAGIGVLPGRGGLVHVHFLLVGWVCITIMGTMTQFVPVWSNVALHSRRLANAGLGSVAAGLLGFGTALSFLPVAWLVPFAALMLAGFWTFVYNIARTLAGVFARGGAAALGVFGAFAVISVLAVVASDLIEHVLPAVELSVGALLVGLGIAVLAGHTGSLHVPLPKRRASVLGFALFGALYALAAMACVLPLFLAVTLQSVTFPALGTAVVLGAYAGGFGVLMVGATIATAVGHDALVGRAGEHVGTLTRLAGGVLVAAGGGQMYLAVAG